MNVTPSIYHDTATKREFMSHSQWRNWLTCAAAARAEIFDGYKPMKSEALIVGGYVDRALTSPEDFDAYCKEYAEDIYGKKGGKYAAYVKADILIARLQSDPVWIELMHTAKKQVVMEGVIAGVKWLYMSDLQFERAGQEMVLDLKTACDFEDDWALNDAGRNVKINWIDAAGYWRQLAVGREMFRQTHNEVLPVCGIIGAKKPVTDERPVGLGLWVLDDSARMNAEIKRIGELTPMVMGWKDGSVPAPKCGKCDYCLSVSSLEEEQEAKSEREYTV